MSQLKFILKIRYNIWIGEGTGSLGPSPGYALAQDLKKLSLTEKIRPVMPILPSHAGVMPVTEKKPDYYRLSSQVLLHPKLGS